MLAGHKGAWGPTAVLHSGGMEVLVVAFPSQMRDLQQLRVFGTDPAARRAVSEEIQLVADGSDSTPNRMSNPSRPNDNPKRSLRASSNSQQLNSGLQARLLS